MSSDVSSDSLRPSARLGCLYFVTVPAAVLFAIFSLFYFEGGALLWAIGLSALVALGSVLGMRSYMRRITAWSARKDDEFWEWFAANEATYRDLSPNDIGGQVEAVEVIGEAIGNVDSRLKCEVHYSGDCLPQLVLSADGDAWMFEAIDTLFAKMPPQEHWEVIALKPRHAYTDEMKMVIAGQEISLAALAYSLGVPDSEDKLPITLYVDGYGTTNEADVRGYRMFAHVIMQFLLGERVMGEALGEVSFQSLAEAPAQGHWPLSVFAEHFDQTREHYRQQREAENVEKTGE